MYSDCSAHSSQKRASDPLLDSCEPPNMEAGN